MGRFERLGASPAAATELMRMNSQIDISSILPTIRFSTLVVHRTGDGQLMWRGAVIWLSTSPRLVTSSFLDLTTLRFSATTPI